MESRSVCNEDLKQTSIPDGPCDVKTTVWYGKVDRSSRKKPKTKSLVLNGIRSAAAIFLLEAVVLMSASAQWSGAWTQRHYGTGQADIWEVFAAEPVVTKVAWRQGWLPLEPLTTAPFGKTSFQQYVADTLSERAPRLAVIECPAKIWYQTTTTTPISTTLQSRRVKRYAKP